MKTNCAQQALNVINALYDDDVKRRARKRLEEICMQYLPFEYMDLCRHMNALELHRVCEEAQAR